MNSWVCIEVGYITKGMREREKLNSHRKTGGEEICVFERKNEIEGVKRNREVIEDHYTEGHVNHLNTKRRMRFVMRK